MPQKSPHWKSDDKSLVGATTAGPNSTSYGFLTNDTSAYADDLARAVGDNYPTSRSTYAVTCQVDLTQAVGLRMLNYSRSDSIGQWQQVGTSVLAESGF